MYQKKPYQNLWPGMGSHFHASPPLRIGDTERDEVAAALREHYAQGRLTPEELNERLEATLAARTTDELARILDDLPRAGHTAGSSPWQGVTDGYRPPPVRRKEVLTPLAIFALAIIALITSRGGSLFLIFVLGLVVALAAAATFMIVFSKRRRSSVARSGQHE
jgi:hypothetical protein